MSTYKRVNGDLIIETIGANDSVTIRSSLGNAQAEIILDGNVTITGNTALAGNLAVSSIFSGNSSVDIPSPGANVRVTVNGVTNVGSFTPSGLNILGTTSASGNITGGNLLTGGLISATGNVTGGNLNSLNSLIVSSNAAVITPTVRVTSTNQVENSGVTLGSYEWFTSDITAPGARVSSALRAITTDAAGNTRIDILTGSPLTSRITVLPTGNVGIANIAPNTTLGITGTLYVSGNTTVLANVQGGNLRTTGLISATGSVTSNSFSTSGTVSATGNIVGGNVISLGAVSAGAAGVFTTGNVRGGNVNSDGRISATGNIDGTNLLTQGIVSATGNILGNNISAGNVMTTGVLNASSSVSAAGNVTGSNITTAGTVSALGSVQSGNLLTSGITSGTGNIITSAYFIGDGGFLSNVTAVSNVAVSQISNGTSFLAVAFSNGNIFATISGVGNVLVMSPTGISVTGSIISTGNLQSSNLRTTGTVSSTGNIIGGNVSGTTGTFTTIIGNANASALTSGIIPSDRLTGIYAINISGTSAAANLVYDNAQPNITSVGTLTSLSVSGNVQGGNLRTGGLISATGGVTAASFTGNGRALTSLNAGNLDIGTVPSARLSGTYTITVSGAATTAGTVTTAAQPNITSVGTLTALTVTGNTTSGNLLTGGLVSATGGVTAATFTGNGRALTSLNAGNLDIGTVPSARLSGTYTITVSGAATTAGTVTTAAQPNITSVGTLTALTVTGNTTSGNLLTGGLVSAAGGVTAASFTGNGRALTSLNAGNLDIGTVPSARLSGTYTITVSGAATTAGTVTTAAQPNITSVGTLTALTVTGNITGGNLITAGLVSLSSINKTGSNGVGNIGSASNYFNRVFATATTALYADLAEIYNADFKYSPGTVVSFGGVNEITISDQDSDRRVAGVVSTNPSYIMNAALTSDFSIAVALQGRVPCLVQGSVRKGDMMVSAGNGRARAEINPSIGSVIGKSLEDFNGELGIIEVVVGRM